MATPEVVGIIRKWVLSSSKDINNMLKIVQRNNISVDVVNKLPIMRYGSKKRYHTSKYTILNNGTYYVRYDWEKNQTDRNTVILPYPWYREYGCNFKLVILMFL